MKTVCLFIGAVAYVNGASILNVDPVLTPGSPDVVVATAGLDDFAWRYDSQSLTNSHAPADWHMVDTTAVTGSQLCSDTTVGTSQSPINIVAADARAATADIGAVTTTLFDTDITGALANTGRVARWIATGNANPTISGGPLRANAVYSLSHIDFHFGSTDTLGSEHEFEGARLPMEMQMVFYDGTFANSAAARASTNADALATISQLFTVGTAANTGLTPITSQLTNIEFADPTTVTGRKKREASTREGRQVGNDATAWTAVDLSMANTNLVSGVVINIEDIIGRTAIDNYFHYDGSMTEPNCRENTRWIINKDRSTVSAAQLTSFRTLKSSETTAATTPTGHQDMLQDNFRPRQALGTRVVGQRDAPFTIDETKAQILGATVVGVGVFNVVNELLKQNEVAKSLVENPLTNFISNIDLNPFADQKVVQQRSSVEAAPQQQQYAPAYPQPVYQSQGYQQYAPQPVPTPTQ